MSDDNKMPVSDSKLNTLFMSSPAPVGLEKNLKQNLSDQIKAEEARFSIKYWQTGLALSVAANVLLAILVLAPGYKAATVNLIEQAYLHLHHEIEGHSIADNTAWLGRRGIQMPPHDYRVAIAKNCLVGTNHVQHVRLTNAQQQAINLLVFSKDDDKGFPIDDMGEKGRQQWIKVHPRKDTHILAFFDNTISNSEVNTLIDKMFDKTIKYSL